MSFEHEVQWCNLLWRMRIPNPATLVANTLSELPVVSSCGSNGIGEVPAPCGRGSLDPDHGARSHDRARLLRVVPSLRENRLHEIGRVARGVMHSAPQFGASSCTSCNSMLRPDDSFRGEPGAILAELDHSHRE